MKNMKGIRSRLFRASLYIVGAVIFSGSLFLIMNMLITDQYQSITNDLSTEYHLTDAASRLIAAFNTRVRSVDTASAQTAEQQIQDDKAQITNISAALDRTIVDPQSVASYTGLKNTIGAVIDEVDQGLSSLKQNDLAASSAHYDQANTKYSFVQEAGTRFLIDELKYADGERVRLDAIYHVSVVGNIFALLFISMGCIAYLLWFSGRIARPLVSLADVAQRVANNEEHVDIDQALKEERDEIGSLARSLDIMLRKLFENINVLNATNQEVAKSSNVLVEKNAELAKLNALMVNRELKMVELKKENQALRAQIPTRTPQ